MKNLTIFSKHFWPENFKINEVALNLKKEFNINVFTSKPNYNNLKYKKVSNIENFKGITINYFPTYRKKKNNFTNIFFDYFSYILISVININFYIKKSCDVCFTYATSPIFQSLPAIYYSKLKKIPNVLWVQDLWPEVLEDTGYIKNKTILKFINKFVSFIYLKSDLIIAQSDSFKKHLERNYNLSNKIYTLHQPADYSFQRFVKKKLRYTYITYAGNFGQAQDFKTIISAFKSNRINKHVKLNLIGSGKNFKFLQNLIEKNDLKNKIILKPYMNKKKLFKVLKSSSAFYITLKNGKSLNKTIPGKFQSYISFGKPILISSNSDLNRIIVKNGIGFASKCNDVKGLIKNINKISDLQISEKKKIYLSSKKVYEKNFDINIITNELLKILKIAKNNYVKKNLL